MVLSSMGSRVTLARTDAVFRTDWNSKEARSAGFAPALQLRLKFGFAPADRFEMRPPSGRISERKTPLLRSEIRPGILRGTWY